MILPLALAALAGALILSGYVRFAEPHSGPSQPIAWTSDTAYLTGGSNPDPYTSCLIAPDTGQRKWIEIPGSGSGIEVTAWFGGHASITCGRSVVITTGWKAWLYPYASSQPVVVGLAALAVVAWWYSRRTPSL